ncbi:MAG: hypothetical protein ACC742_17345, partial [Thermoanaerobaculales bacterium]
MSNNLRRGAAGTVYLFDTGGSTHGDLVVDNAGLDSGHWTDLPSLGSGIAQTGSTGVVLETGLTETVPDYFVGHWVEVSQPDGTLKGTWRIEAVSGTMLTLDAGANVAESDSWQGVYRFDSVRVAGYGEVQSTDPIRTNDVTLTDGGRLNVSEPIEVTTLVLGGGTSSPVMWSPITATGSVEVVGPGTSHARSIESPVLTVRSGATLSHPSTASVSSPESLHLVVTDLVIEDGGAIDASGRGYAFDTTYPGAVVGSDSRSAGSHLGEGGAVSGTSGETYGSVTRPQENGAGGRYSTYGKRGGGVLRIEAQTVDLQGTAAIRANGWGSTSNNFRGGAGGSVWITAGAVTGTGVIEASGGSVPSYESGGGGGAIAIEYGTMDAAIEAGLRAVGGDVSNNLRRGAAGTVYLYQSGGSIFGDLVVGNSGLGSDHQTVLPSLGAGVAQAGSTGVALETGLAETVPAYLVGHWVEVRDSGGALTGTWRIEAISGTTLTLEAGASVAEGDLWQGVYRFDSVLVTGNARLRVGDLDEFGLVTVDPGA